MTEETVGTPRVDAFVESRGITELSAQKPGFIYGDLVILARQLEREVAALTTQREISKQSIQSWTDSAAMYCENADYWKKRAEAAEAELDAPAKHWHDLYQKQCLLRQDDAARYGQQIQDAESRIKDQVDAYVELEERAHKAESALALAAEDTAGLEELIRSTEAELDAAKRALAEKAEIAWLIEMPDARWGTGYFWCGPEGLYSSGAWGGIDEAIRFTRKEDAERVIKKITGAHQRDALRLEACEHMWPAALAAKSTEPADQHGGL